MVNSSAHTRHVLVSLLELPVLTNATPVATITRVTLKFPHPWPHELHGFFGSPDSEDDNETTIQAYEHTDLPGVTLRFSFDWIRASVQTRLSVGGVVLETVSHEGVTSIVIDGFALTCTFDSATEQTVCAITLTPRIEVTWSHLHRE